MICAILNVIVPFQQIVCWGSSLTMFRFHLMDTVSIDEKKKDILVTLRTKRGDGKIIESTLMSSVRSLMTDMEKKAVSKEEFSSLLAAILNESRNELKVKLIK